MLKRIRRSIVNLIIRHRGIHTEGNVHISLRGRAVVHRGGSLRVSKESWILRGYTLEVESDAVIEVGKEVHFGENVRLHALSGARITVGNNVWFNHDVEVVSRTEILIGDGTRVGQNVLIIDHDHEVKASALIREQGYTASSIRVGSEVWIGAKATLLQGCSVGDGAVLAAGAILTKPIPNGEIWAGAPARKIGERR